MASEGCSDFYLTFVRLISACVKLISRFIKHFAGHFFK